MRVRSIPVAVVVAVAWAALAACDSPTERVATSTAITGGTPTAGDGAVVALVVPALTCGEAEDVFCTGTLVGPRAVVTAAHCLDYAPPGTLQVHIGADATAAASGVRVEVVAQLAHPAFASIAHDVAVLELAQAVAEAPVALHAGRLDSALVGAQVRIVGFGADDDRVLGHKREGTATIASIDADTFGLTPAPGNTCVGDSGGPVFMQVGETEVLIGVTSFGDPSCSMSATNTRVDANRDDFLLGTIAGIAAAPPPGPRAPLTGGASLCDMQCVGIADCPAGTACVDGRCGLAGRAAGRFAGLCETGADCADDVCAPVGGASCECYEPCDDCSGGCATGPRTPSGRSVVPVLLALVAITRRRRARLAP